MGLGHGEKSQVGKESFRPPFDQAIPFASFDAVFQRRQHALLPHRGFHPRPVPAVSLCALCSPCGHCRRFAFALPLGGTHASTFLPPVPRRSFALCASRGCWPLRYHEGSDSCTRSPRVQGSLFTSPHLPVVPSPTTWAAWTSLCPPRQRAQLLPDFTMNEQARRSSPPNRVRSPTDRQFASGCSPPCLEANAVTFGYGVVAYSGTDFHRANVAPLQAHSLPQKRESRNANNSGFPFARE